VVLRDHTPHQAWLALGLFLVSPAAVYALADHYLVDPVAYAFLAGMLLLLQRDRLTLAAAVCVLGLLDKEPVLFAAPIVLLLAVRARAWAPFVIILVGAPSLYLVIHRTDWIASGAGREFPYFTEANLSSVVANQGGCAAGAPYRPRGRSRTAGRRRRPRVAVDRRCAAALGAAPRTDRAVGRHRR
jgi:hypothetical protein